VTPNQQNILTAVLSRAATDWDFRQQLLSDPCPAIERAFGVTIPPQFRVRFIERDAALDSLVVLPDFRGGVPDGEVSERELEAVTGGGGGGTLW
jgi:hypothetical protein